MLLNGHIAIKTYVIENDKVLVVVEDGADLPRVKEFLLEQPEVTFLEIDSKKVYPAQKKGVPRSEKSKGKKGKEEKGADDKAKTKGKVEKGRSKGKVEKSRKEEL
jgi:hypothetical protein